MGRSDDRPPAGVAGSVALAFNAINYVEGRWQDESDPDSLALRSLALTGTPLVGEVLRETGRDGTSALTVWLNPSWNGSTACGKRNETQPAQAGSSRGAATHRASPSSPCCPSARSQSGAPGGSRASR